MTSRRTLLALAFVVFFLSMPRAAAAQGFCPEVVGMSACDAAYPVMWADCVAGAYLDDCLSDPAQDPQWCWDAYDQIWSMEYQSASRDCQRIADECELVGGTINDWGGCNFPPSGGGSDCPDDGSSGGGGMECSTEYIEIQVDYGDGNWITIWEGWATVCEYAQ
jgi:hypothetical protein